MAVAEIAGATNGPCHNDGHPNSAAHTGGAGVHVPTAGLRSEYLWTTQGWKRDLMAGSSAGDVVRARFALPGMPNLHSHAFQRGMAGLTERRGPGDDSFWTWRQLIYRFVGRLSPDDVEAITAFAYMEMLEQGFTSVGEFHYVHHDVDGAPYADLAEMATRIAAAAAQTGIGMTLLPVLYTNNGFGGTPPS